jgi:hypothetical protein
VPKDLTDEQREAVEKLADSLNGRNPRTSLFGQAPTAATNTAAGSSGAGERVED